MIFCVGRKGDPLPVAQLLKSETHPIKIINQPALHVGQAGLNSSQEHQSYFHVLCTEMPEFMAAY